MINKDTFIKKALDVHGLKYAYSMLVYKNFDTKVDILCPKHGLFKQRPGGHLSGKGCERCARELPHYNELTTGKFIDKAKGVPTVQLKSMRTYDKVGNSNNLLI